MPPADEVWHCQDILATAVPNVEKRKQLIFLWKKRENGGRLTEQTLKRPKNHTPHVLQNNTTAVFFAKTALFCSTLYEEVYCARGEMENRIKEVQLMLFSDRTSCHGFRANRCRLLLSSYAYILVETIRRTALHGTPMERAQCGTIREKLFKIAAVVKVSVRRNLSSLPTSCPVQDLWLRVYDRLRLDRLHEVLPLPTS